MMFTLVISTCTRRRKQTQYLMIHGDLNCSCCNYHSGGWVTCCETKTNSRDGWPFQLDQKSCCKGWRCSINGRHVSLNLLNNLLTYYISQLIRALWLVNLAGHTLLYGPPNSKVCFCRHAKCQRYNKYLTNLVFSVLTISYGSSFFPLGFMAQARSARGP